MFAHKDPYFIKYEAFAILLKGQNFIKSRACLFCKDDIDIDLRLSILIHLTEQNQTLDNLGSNLNYVVMARLMFHDSLKSIKH